MDSGTPQETGSKHESTSSTDKVNVRLDEDNALAVQHVTEIIEKIDLKPAESETRKQLLNKRAISKIASTYELETFKENLLIIFYHENIEGFKKRIGSERYRLKETFKKFGFVFKEHKDCKMDKIFRKLEEYTHPSNDLSKYGCVAVAVITYGTDDRQLRAKDMPYSETEIYKRLVLNKNQTLITKPKVIIIEAFPGEELNPKDEVDCPGITVRDSDEMDYSLPRESDSLILYSHYARSPSRRSRLERWFIRELCEKINRHASELDLESIMTDVLNQVNNPNLNLPVVISTMTRKLFLRKFGDEPPLSFKNMYFNFAKTCLKYYIEEKPHDGTANGWLEKANKSSEDIVIGKSILDYLMLDAQDCQCFKQMHVLNN